MFRTSWYAATAAAATDMGDFSSRDNIWTRDNF